jgi:hypothetical protein
LRCADDPLPASRSASLENLLVELRALAYGPVPAPSAQLEAFLAGDAGAAPAPRRFRWRRKAIAGAIVLGSTGAGLSGVAAAADNRAPRAAPVVASSVAPAPAVRAPAPRQGPSSVPTAVRPRPARSSTAVGAVPHSAPKPVHVNRPAVPTGAARIRSATDQESTDEWWDTVESTTKDRAGDSETDHEQAVTRGGSSTPEESGTDGGLSDSVRIHTREFRQPVVKHE